MTTRRACGARGAAVSPPRSPPACTNAGYHCELAGGGHYSEAALRAKLDALIPRLRPGDTITLNVLYLNAHQWGFQYPLAVALRKQGYPIDGLCVAAGVPSADTANDIIANLQAAGFRHVAFKPGSVEGYRTAPCQQLAGFTTAG